MTIPSDMIPVATRIISSVPIIECDKVF